MTYICFLCKKAFNVKNFKKHVECFHQLEFEKYLRDVHYGFKVGYCLQCGKETKLKSMNKGLFSKYCDNKCQLKHYYDNQTEEQRLVRSKNISDSWSDEMKEKQSAVRKEQCANKTKEQYAVEKEKARATKLEKYGDENYGDYNSEHFKEIMLERYGVDNAYKLQKFSKNGTPEKTAHVRETCQKRYGTDWVPKPKDFDANIEKRIETCNARYGVDHYMQSEQEKKYSSTRMKKARETKKKNGTVNTSKQENSIYLILCKHFDDVKREFRSEKYPFYCDFYVPCIDLYIEYNGFFTHGKHPFTGTEKDNQELLFMIEKGKKSTFNSNAVNVWTVSDPKKLKAAKDNNLNYLVLYRFPSETELLNLINEQQKRKSIIITERD